MDLQEFHRLLDDLVAAGVFEETKDGDLSPTEAFLRRREAHRSSVADLDDAGFEERLQRYGVDDPSAADVPPEVLGDAMAIAELAADVGGERCLLAAQALERADLAETPAAVPAGFVPVDPEEIQPFLRAHPAAILYVWREDCDPCDDVREYLETMLEEGELPEAVGLGAVYGPADPALLRDEYQVAVSPTLLFCKDGRIDSRIIGPRVYGAILNEVRIITEDLG